MLRARLRAGSSAKRASAGLAVALVTQKTGFPRSNHSDTARVGNSHDVPVSTQTPGPYDSRINLTTDQSLTHLTQYGNCVCQSAQGL